MPSHKAEQAIPLLQEFPVWLYSTLSQQLHTSLYGSCVQRCNLHANYCLRVIYTNFDKERSTFDACSITLIKTKTFHVLAVWTAYKHQLLHVCSLHVTNSNISCCKYRCSVSQKLINCNPWRCTTLKITKRWFKMRGANGKGLIYM